MSVQLNILFLICINRQYPQKCIEFDNDAWVLYNFHSKYSKTRMNTMANHICSSLFYCISNENCTKLSKLFGGQFSIINRCRVIWSQKKSVFFDKIQHDHTLCFDNNQSFLAAGRFNESWLRWAQESIRTCFSWIVSDILWRYTICYNAVHTE